MSEIDALRPRTFLFFDFDGVLSTLDDQGVAFDGVVDRILKLHENPENALFIASFNPAARDTLRKWGILHCFTALRHGANVAWGNWSEYTLNRMKWRAEMHKAEQLLELMDEADRLDIVPSTIHFFDDQENNLDLVKERFRNIHYVYCYHIDNAVGLQDHHLNNI